MSLLIRKQFLGGASARVVADKLCRAITEGEMNRMTYIREALEEVAVLARELDKFGKEHGYDTPEKIK